MDRSNEQIAEIFQCMADLLETKGENPYRVRAYRRAAESLVTLEETVEATAQRGALEKVPGIGRELANKILEYLKSRKIQAYESLKRPLPAAIADWTTLPGLSEPVVQHLHFRLGLTNLDDLAALVRSHMLRTLPGFTGDESILLDAIAQRQSPSDLAQ